MLTVLRQHSGHDLASRIAAVWRRNLFARAVLGLSLIATLGFAWLALLMWADWSFELSRATRFFLIAPLVVIALAMIVRYVAQPLFYGPDEDDIALAIERRETRYRGRLIATVQLTRARALDPGASHGLVGALVEQTRAMSTAVDFGQIVSTRAAKAWCLGALCLGVLWTSGFAICRPVSAVLLRRAMLANVPVPRKTAIEEITGDLIIARGQSVTLTARANGLVPPTGQVRLNFPDQILQYTMRADTDESSRFSWKMDNVQQSFSYQVFLNDGRGRDCSVRVVDLPNVADVFVLAVPPPYTHVKPAPVQSSAINVLAGSRLSVIVLADKPLASQPHNGSTNRLEFTAAAASAPLAIPAAESPRAAVALAQAARIDADLQHVNASGRESFIKDFLSRNASRCLAVAGLPDTDSASPWQGAIPLPTTATGFSIHLLDADGFANKDPSTFRITQIADQPPSISLADSGAEIWVTRNGKVDLPFNASDDWGISQVSVCYRLSNGRGQSAVLPLPGIAQATPHALSDHASFDLKSVPLDWLAAMPTSEQSTIECWLEASDNNNISGPGQSRSESTLLRIVTPAQLRKQLMSRLNTLPQELAPIERQQSQIGSQLNALRSASAPPSTQESQP